MSCFSKQILDYFYNIQNTGRILKPEAIGRAGSKQEGTVIEFSWRVKDEVILDARFRTFGDVNAIAISSVLTSMMIGKTIGEVLNINADDILEHLQDNKPNYLYLTDLALSALANTYENYIKKFTKANPELAKTNEFAETLRENLAKIQKDESLVEEDYELSNVGNIEENSDEESYLTNLKNYEKTIAENSIEKSLKNLLYGYSSVENGEIKEKEFNHKEKSKEKTSFIQTNGEKRGRGRPKKERTPEELEAENNKVVRGRGRPKKERISEELEEDIIKVKRGRGRPKKEKTAEELEAEKNKVVRGRGRPKKEVAEVKTNNEVTTQKRGRGRPRRVVEENEPNNIKTIEENDNISQSLEAVEENSISQALEINYDEKEINYDVEEERAQDFAKDEDALDSDEKIVEENEEASIDAEEWLTNKNDELESDLSLAKEIDLAIEEDEPKVADKVLRGRGRPKKERTPEELEAEKNKVVRGRGRPKKERTQEELEAEKNKVKRGRGRPKKDDNSVFGIVSLREENSGEEFKPSVINVKNAFETDLRETTTRGRGRPKKEKTPEELEAEKNKVVRGRGRPKKERTEEPKEIEFESQAEIETFNNDFAPKQNKYGVGLKTTTYFATQTKTVRIEKTKHNINDDEVAGSVIKKYNLDETNNKTIEHKIIGDDAEEFLSQPLSDDVNNILKNGGSIEEALKALMENDD